jgi:hypothetical protein
MWSPLSGRHPGNDVDAKTVNVKMRRCCARRFDADNDVLGASCCLVVRARKSQSAGLEIMTYINDNYLKLPAGYLFAEIGRRVKKFCDENHSARSFGWVLGT